MLASNYYDIVTSLHKILESQWNRFNCLHTCSLPRASNNIFLKKSFIKDHEMLEITGNDVIFSLVEFSPRLNASRENLESTSSWK